MEKAIAALNDLKAAVKVGLRAGWADLVLRDLHLLLDDVT